MKNELLEKIAYEYNYDSMVFDNMEKESYPEMLVETPYYGFYLVAKRAGELISQDSFLSDFHEIRQTSEIDSILVAFRMDDAKKRSDISDISDRSLPLTLRLMLFLNRFVTESETEALADTEEKWLNSINRMVRGMESGRLPKDPFRRLDRILARKWCRVLRLFIILQMPSFSKEHQTIVYRDLRVSKTRGIAPGYLRRIEYRARFNKLADHKMTGKIILLAEEWETRCVSGEIIGNPFMYELIGLAYLDTDENYKTGYEWLSLLIGRHPDNIDFLKWKARYLRREEKYDQAHEVCAQILEKNPIDYETHCFESNLYYIQEKYKEAQKSALIATSCDEHAPMGYIALAFSYLNDQQYDEAVSAFNRALDLESDNTDALRGKSKALVMIGEGYDAMNCLVRAARFSPDNAELFRELADVYFMSGYVDECRRYCRKSLSLDPYSAPAFVLLGMLEIRENHITDAVKWLRHSLTIEPKNPIALNELAYIEHMNGNDDECLRLLEQALNIAPDFADVICSMGVVYYFKGDYDSSNALLDRALELDPFHVGAMVTKGNALLTQSLPDEALNWYERALEIEEDYPDAIRGKFDALRAMGLEEEAAEWIRKEGDSFDENDR